MTSKLQGGKTAKELRKERETRVMDAIRLKKTDRVPIICGMGYFPAKYAGLPCSAAYYDYDAWYRAYQKTLQDYDADLVFSQNFMPGKVLEILNSRLTRWPGYNADPNHGHQAIEIVNMEPGEYDDFLKDPSDYMFRTHMSRTSDEFTGLALLPKLADVQGVMGAQMLAGAMSDPEVAHTFETLLKAGREMRKWGKRLARFSRMMEDCGYPQYFQGAALPPFDILSHSMRGMTGTMQDMFRQPEKVEQACEKILELTLARPVGRPSENGYTRYFMTNTRGSDDFMSMKHFDRFYWPTAKKLILGLIEKGITPCIFFEGNFTSRLEYLLELPRGSTLVRLDTTDIFKIVEIHVHHNQEIHYQILQNP